MSKTLQFEAKTVLLELKHLRRSTAEHYKSLHKYGCYRLRKTHRTGAKGEYYYLVGKGNRKAKYLGTSANKTVQLIKEAKFTGQLLQIIDRDIKLLEKLGSEFVIPEHDVIMNMLPETYRDPVIHNLNEGNEKAAEWKRRKEKEKAKHKPFLPEDLIYEARDGTRMRSLSEVIIANYLLSLGITFVYECPLCHHGKTILPDFTILSPVDYKTEIIIEHQGAMNDHGYQAKFIRTLLFYLATKLVPNKDVFFTFSHLDGNLDLRQIDSILRIAFGFEKETQAK